MPLDEEQPIAALVLAAELGAALPARRAAVEFARHFAGDKDPGHRKALVEIKVAETRLAAVGDQPGDNAGLLARLAVAEAGVLEAEAGLLDGWLNPDGPDPGQGTVRLVAGLLWEARYGEGRARACLSARRQRRFLPGFDDALELAPEDELLFLALRRFSGLLHSGAVWAKADLDWLRLRAATLPGRLRLRAADLRSAAEGADGLPLPEDLVELRRPFVQFGYEPGPALAWGVAGFTLKEALVWGAAGLPWASQALAWKAWGHSAHEAAAWASADLLPDEAAAFKACGATDPAQARDLRHALGDVENLLAWHRAGFATAEVLKLRAEGVKDVEAALKARRAEQAKATPVPAPIRTAGAGVRAPGGEAPRTKRSAPVPDLGAEGGAWVGWAVYEPGGGELDKPRSLTRSRALGEGLVDVVNASEGVALNGAPCSLPSLLVDAQWQEQLDWHRQSAGRESQPGRWLLAALPPLRAQLYWGLIFKTPVSPWGTAIDFDSSETWAQRWKRKAEEFGEPGLAVPCQVSRTPSGGWVIAAPGSMLEHEGPQPRPLDALDPDVAWIEAVDRFCLIMGLGKKEQAWHLLALEKA
jgi:hypothetical protein